ncbi:MAG: LytR/AlgR family response regulator transcription factor [Vicinamibacteraceae bacterium]
MDMLRVVIVDDEPLARAVVREYAAAHPDVEIAAECGNGFDAVKAVAELSPDLVFLDVQMPKLNGFEVLELLGRDVPVIFTTAYDQYALRAFEVHAVDYLLKPFSDERFEASLDRALRHVRAGHAEALLSQMQALLDSIEQPHEIDGAAPSSSSAAHRGATLDRIVLKGAGRVRLLPVQQITWIEAAGMYVKLHTRDGAAHLHRSLLGQLDAVLDKRRFIRVHRSAIVNIDLIDELQADAHGDYIVVLKDRTEIRLGRRYRARLQDRLGQGL